MLRCGGTDFSDSVGFKSSAQKRRENMSEYHFMGGTGRGRVSKAVERKVDSIVKPMGVTFITATMPGDGARHWFATRNYGFPFNDAKAREVFDALAKANVKLP